MKKLAILFLCIGNSCRSQMAEGWARRLKPDSLDPFSAGTNPHAPDPLAVRVMAEAGVDISRHRSKHLDEFKGIAFDWVVTVCDSADESCPWFPGKTKRMHRSFDDPPRLARSAATEEEILGIYRRVRDEIRVFVKGMPANLAEKPI
jgi:arsenate reductase (thioredoxin)